MVQIDIQMPSDCYSCWVRKNMGCKIANDSGWLNNKRDDNCPLKEKKAVEQKIGHWTYLQFCANEGVYCSECHTKMFDRYPMKKKLSQFCGHCGAKMERR